MIALGAEMPVRHVLAFTAPDIDRYVEAGGDSNRIHRDENYARSFGLNGLVVPGMQVLGECEIALAQWCAPEVKTLSARFVRPVISGEPLTVHGKVVARSDTAGAHFVVRLTVRMAAGQVACIADAHVAAA